MEIEKYMSAKEYEGIYTLLIPSSRSKHYLREFLFKILDNNCNIK